MIILIEKFPRCFWHIDCPEKRNFAPPMRPLFKKSEPEFKVVDCPCCGQVGELPKGTPFGVEVEVKKLAESLQELEQQQ